VLAAALGYLLFAWRDDFGDGDASAYAGDAGDGGPRGVSR
jgi:hypothetical protein